MNTNLNYYFRQIALPKKFWKDFDRQKKRMVSSVSLESFHYQVIYFLQNIITRENNLIK